MQIGDRVRLSKLGRKVDNGSNPSRLGTVTRHPRFTNCGGGLSVYVLWDGLKCPVPKNVKLLKVVKRVGLREEPGL